MAASEASSIPLRHRLAAWWRGYDPVEYYAWQTRGEAPRATSIEDLIPPMPVLSTVDHAKARVDVLQQLFGTGFTSPGGAEHVLEMVKPFGLTPVHSFLDLSAGLGGPAAAVAQHFGVWVTGYEMDPELAEWAPVVIPTLKGGDHVTVRGFTPNEFNLRPQSFDRVISREALFAIRDRAALLKQLHTILKDWGQLVVTDYILPVGGAPSERVRNWLESEDLTYAPWSVAEYEKALLALGFDVRVMEDRSGEHQRHIRDHFSRFVQELGGQNPFAENSAHRAALMVEAERWARRASLLEQGDLAFYRFFVLKPEWAGT